MNVRILVQKAWHAAGVILRDLSRELTGDTSPIDEADFRMITSPDDIQNADAVIILRSKGEEVLRMEWKQVDGAVLKPVGRTSTRAHLMFLESNLKDGSITPTQYYGGTFEMGSPALKKIFGLLEAHHC